MQLTHGSCSRRAGHNPYQREKPGCRQCYTPCAEPRGSQPRWDLCPKVWMRSLQTPPPPHFGRDPHRAQLRRGVIYLVNFEGRHFNCFKLPLEKLEWSTINQADLAPRAHPLRAGNQLPPPDPLLMNFAGLLISCERTARPR